MLECYEIYSLSTFNIFTIMKSIFSSPAQPQTLGASSVGDVRRAAKLKMLFIQAKNALHYASLHAEAPASPDAQQGAGVGMTQLSPVEHRRS
jgi:hypothetical protein